MSQSQQVPSPPCILLQFFPDELFLLPLFLPFRILYSSRFPFFLVLVLFSIKFERIHPLKQSFRFLVRLLRKRIQRFPRQ